MRCRLLFVVVLLALRGPASGALQSFGPVSLADGFPIWYEDANGLKLELCLDGPVAAPDGSTLLPCLTGEPFPGLPVSFPSNFGTEAVYWNADGFTSFTDSNGVTGFLLLVAELQASFLDLIPTDGEQAAFARIRLRMDTPVAGTYQITHPFGQATFEVPLGGGRFIDETQDVGLPSPRPEPFDPTASFQAALGDGPAPAPAPGGAVPRVDEQDRSIGPFLIPAGDPGSRVVLNGNVYLSVPVRIPAGGLETEQPVALAGGPNGNVTRVTLTNGPPGYFLDAANSTNVVTIETFSLMGKVFNEGANVAPQAEPDQFTATAGEPTILDVLANDVDVRDADPLAPGATNVHGLNVQAVALVSGNDRVKTFTTANGATVTRVVNLADGKASLTYEAPAGFVGTDTFDYVTQDSGGLLSEPATVTVTVQAPQPGTATSALPGGGGGGGGCFIAAAGETATSWPGWLLGLGAVVGVALRRRREMKPSSTFAIAACVLLGLSLTGCGGGGGGGGSGAPALPFGPATELAPLSPEGFSSAVAINDGGQVVGQSELVVAGEPTIRAVVWTLPSPTPAELPPLDQGTSAAAYDVDDGGRIVGESENGAGGVDAVVWNDAGSPPVALPRLPQGGSAAAYAINSSGLIAGEAENAELNGRAVLWTVQADGTVVEPEELGVLPPGVTSSAYAVSEPSAATGTSFAVGEAQGPSGPVAVAWTVAADGAVNGPIELGTLPGHVGSAAFSVSEDGTVVGESEAADGKLHAVQWAVTAAGASAGPVDLGGAGTLSSAFAVNQAGRIVGKFRSGTGPESASMWEAAQPASIVGTVLSRALGIDGHGRVVGSRTTPNGERAFVAVPLR